MEEHSRRRGAQQGAEGRPAGRGVGAVFLMTISWAVSPHPHRVAHFKYHEIVNLGKISWKFVMFWGQTPPGGNPDFLGGGSDPPSGNLDLLGGGSTPPSSYADLLGGGSGVSLSRAPPPGSEVRVPSVRFIPHA